MAVACSSVMAWLGRPSFPLGVVTSSATLRQHLVTGLGLPDGPLEDRVDPLQAPGRELAGQPVEPLVDLVGGQLP